MHEEVPSSDDNTSAASNPDAPTDTEEKKTNSEADKVKVVKNDDATKPPSTASEDQ